MVYASSLSKSGVSSPVDGLTIKIIDPSKYDKEVDFDNWENEETKKELGRRLTLGRSPAPKEAEVYIRRSALAYYMSRSGMVRALFHEIYHANDPELIRSDILIDSFKKEMLPTEIRAKKYADKMYQRLKDKRKIIMTNAEVKRLRARMRAELGLS